MKGIMLGLFMLFIAYNLLLSATQDPPKEFKDGMDCIEAVDLYRQGRLSHSIVNNICSAEAWR